MSLLSSLRIIILSIILSSIYSVYDIHASWIPAGSLCTQSNSTEVYPGWSAPFNKNEGQYILCLRQPFLVYIYAGKDIAESCVDARANGGGCNCTYTVGGQPYNSSHPLWQHKISAPDARNVCGGQQFIQPNKNAQVTEYKIFTKEYWYDTSYPLCANVEYFWRATPTSTPQQLTNYNGSWNNKDIYARGMCDDRFSGCIQARSVFLTLTHLAETITPTLSDTVGHITSATCNLGFTVGYDPTKPEIASLRDSTNTIRTDSSSVSYYASDTLTYTLEITDSMSPGSTGRGQGVSGIESAVIRVQDTHDYMGNILPQTSTICEESYTSTGPKAKDNTATDRVTLNLKGCTGLRKAGKYKLIIEVTDHAKNILIKDISLHISPNQNLKIKIDNTETYQSRLTENVCRAWTNTSSCAEYESICRRYEDRPSCNRTANVCTATRSEQVCESTTTACIRSEQYCKEYGWIRSGWRLSYICKEYAIQCVEEGPICTKESTQTTCIQEEEQCIEPSTISTCIESEQVCKRTTNTQDCIGGYADVETLTQTGVLYANNRDFYRYHLSVSDIYDNPINASPIRTPIRITGTGILRDELDPSSTGALRISPSGIYSATSVTGAIGSFELRSYVGGVFSQAFSLDIGQWNPDGTTKSDTYHTVGFGDNLLYSFRKLFSTSINLAGPIILGQKQDITLITTRFPYFARITDASINYIDRLYSMPKGGFELRNTVYTGGITASSIGYKSWTNPNETDTTIINTTPILKTRFTDNKIGLIATPIIRYRLDDRYVSYLLGSATDSFFQDPYTPIPYNIPGSPESITPILESTSTDATCNIINSLSIEGITQTTGREGLVSDKISIGQVGWSSVRNTVRKNVALLTRNRSLDNDKVINGVLYRGGDMTLSGNVTWDTLILMDGNLTIDGNFNTDKKIRGIILLNSDTATVKKSHIYIKPNVEYIHATIFADGSIQSVNNEGVEFVASDSTRSTLLNKPIVFQGSLFTRNTIGGATDDGSGNYILPGKVITQEFNEAVRYDLSFLRMCNIPTHSYVPAGKTDSVIVLNNFEAIRNPPPGFTQ